MEMGRSLDKTGHGYDKIPHNNVRFKGTFKLAAGRSTSLAHMCATETINLHIFGEAQLQCHTHASLVR